MIINFNGGGDLSVQKSLPTVGKQGELSVTTDGEYQFVIDRGERFVKTTALYNPRKGSQNQFFKLIGNRNQSTYCVPFYYLTARGYATKEDFEKGNDAKLMAYNYGIATYDSTNEAGEVTYAFTIWTLNNGGEVSGTYYQSEFYTDYEWLNLGEFTVEGIPFAYTDSDAYNWSGVKINMRLAPQMTDDEFFYFECHLEDPYFGTEAVCRLSRVYAGSIGRLNNANVWYNKSGIQYYYPDYKAEWRKAVMTVSPYTEEENMVLQSLGNGKGSQFVDFYENYTNGVKIAHPSIEEFVDMEKDSQTLYIVSDIKALYFGDALLCYNGDGFDVSRGQIDFDIDNLALTFKMRSNKDWTISADSFITLSQTSGTASEDWVEITASVERGIDFKSGVITISNGEIEKQISVTYPQYQVIKAQYDVASIYDESNPRTYNVFYYNLSVNANDYISYVIYNNEYHVAENGMTLDSAFTGEVDFVLRDDATIDGANLWSVVYPLKSIELPSTMKMFWAEQMFTNAQNLSAVTLNDGLETFGTYYLFAYTKITELRIPSSVSRWAAQQAFQGSSIQTLYIGTEDGGSSLTSAGEMPYAFYGCTNLTTIYYYGPNLMNYDNLWVGFEVTGGTVHVASDYGVDTFQYLVDNLGWTIVKDLPARGGLQLKDIDAKGEKVTLDEGVYVSAYSGDLVFNSFDANTNMYFIKTEDWKEKDDYGALVTNDGREDSVFFLEIWGQVWGYNEDGSALDLYEERTDYWYTYEYKNSIVAYKQTSEGVYFCGYGNCKLSDSVASFTTTTVETNPFIVVRNNKTGGDLTATVETSDGKGCVYKQPSL